jgi:hypothetical protein
MCMIYARRKSPAGFCKKTCHKDHDEEFPPSMEGVDDFEHFAKLNTSN